MEVSKKIRTLFTGLCVILLYFVWPYFCSYVLSFLNIDKNLKLFLSGKGIKILFTLYLFSICDSDSVTYFIKFSIKFFVIC